MYVTGIVSDMMQKDIHAKARPDNFLKCRMYIQFTPVSFFTD